MTGVPGLLGISGREGELIWASSSCCSCSSSSEDDAPSSSSTSSKRERLLTSGPFVFLSLTFFFFFFLFFPSFSSGFSCLGFLDFRLLFGVCCNKLCSGYKLVFKHNNSPLQMGRLLQVRDYGIVWGDGSTSRRISAFLHFLGLAYRLLNSFRIKEYPKQVTAGKRSHNPLLVPVFSQFPE